MKQKRFWQGEKSEKQIKRYLFFEEITHSAYHVNLSLRTEVYTPYKSVIPGYFTPRFEELDKLSRKSFGKNHPNAKYFDYEHYDTWEAYLTADVDNYPELIPVREAVIAWSRSNHLDADWCREIAVDTLNYWFREDHKPKYEDPEEHELYELVCYPGGGKYRMNPIVEDKLLPLPGFPPYLPFRHKSLDHYLEEVRRWMQEKVIPQSVWHQLKDSFIGSLPHVSARLDSYIEAEFNRIRKLAATYAYFVEYFYRQKGYTPITPQPEESKFIKWTVQAQIYEGTTFSSIAESENLFNGDLPNTSYVRREVLKVLEAIELSPRSGLLKPGRPKGARDKRLRHRSLQ